MSSKDSNSLLFTILSLDLLNTLLESKDELIHIKTKLKEVKKERKEIDL